MVAFYFGWVEVTSYECLCDDNREPMSLQLLDEDKRSVTIRCTMDPVTFGGRIYRGNTNGEPWTR